MFASSDNSTNTSSNLSLNSLADKHWGVEALVFHVIDESEIEGVVVLHIVPKIQCGKY